VVGREPTNAAVLWSGGKDSTLALHRAVADGIRVTTLFNLYDAETRRVRFHGVRRALISAQAHALELQLVQLPTTPATFENVFVDGLRQLANAGIDSLIAGNIHLADVRSWYEERSTAAGLLHLEPLWGEQPDTVLREVLSLGYRARVTGIELATASLNWLGRDLDDSLAEEFAAAGIDAAGESGEYHTFVHDGPAFTSPVRVATGEVKIASGFAFIDLMAA
jgi:diphthine-ammonia ligase